MSGTSREVAFALECRAPGHDLRWERATPVALISSDARDHDPSAPLNGAPPHMNGEVGVTPTLEAEGAKAVDQADHQQADEDRLSDQQHHRGDADAGQRQQRRFHAERGDGGDDQER